MFGDDGPGRGGGLEAVGWQDWAWVKGGWHWVGVGSQEDVVGVWSVDYESWVDGGGWSYGLGLGCGWWGSRCENGGLVRVKVGGDWW